MNTSGRHAINRDTQSRSLPGLRIIRMMAAMMMLMMLMGKVDDNEDSDAGDGVGDYQ